MDESEQLNDARWLREQVKPKFLIGSPECVGYSNLLNLSIHSRTPIDPIKLDEIRKQSARQLKECVRMYWAQLEEGHDFIHLRLATLPSFRL